MNDTKYKNIIPFSAIIGQERMKKALILNVINPKLGGLLIRGEKGTGKSTAVRALAHLLPEIGVVKDCPYSCDPENVEEMCDLCLEKKMRGGMLSTIKRKIRVIDLPLGVTEDRLLGTLDIKMALKEGIKALEPGILANANRGILYIDEVNLLDDTIADALLDSAAMGVNIIEREGVSVSHPSNFILIGSMNPEEGELRPQLLDRFGLYVQVSTIADRDERFKIASLVNEFETKPDKVRSRYARREESLLKRIDGARRNLPLVKINNKLLRFCGYIASLLDIKTHRAEINLVRAARAIAAYDGRLKVNLGHIKEAADLVLTHRIEAKPFEEPYLDKAILDKKMAMVEELLATSEQEKKKLPEIESREDIDLYRITDIPVVEEGEIFEVGKFYKSRPWDKLHPKKK